MRRNPDRFEEAGLPFLSYGEQAALLSTILAHSTDGMAFIDPELIIRAANTSFVEHVRVPMSRIVGRPGEEVIPGWTEQVGHMCRKTRTTGELFKTEAYPFVFPRQSERGMTYWDSSVSPVYGSDDTFLGWLLLLREVTRRVRADEDREQLARQLREANQPLAIRSIEAQERNEQLAAQNEELQSRYQELRNAYDTILYAREQLARLAAIVESSQDAIIGTTLDGVISSWNSAAEQMYGYTTDEAQGKPISILVPPDHLDEMPAILQGLRRRERIERYETVQVRKDGAKIDVAVTVSPIQSTDGRIVGISTIARDITNRRRAEEALRASEANYRAIFDTASDAIFIHDLETGAILDVNRKMCEMYGFTPEEARQLTVADISGGRAPYTQERALELMRSAVAGTPQLFEWLAKDRCGRSFWVEVSLNRGTIDGQGRLLAIVRDIAQRKQSEEELRNERNFITAVLKTVGCLVVVLDREGRILQFNRACEELTGYSFDEVRDRSFWELFLVPEEWESVRAVFAELSSGHFPNEHENHWLTKDGDRRLISWSNTALVDDAGEVEYVIATGIDVTRRRQAEVALRQSEERYRTLVETANEGVWAVDAEGRITFANSKLAEMLGYSVDELIGLSAFALADQDGRSAETSLELRVQGISYGHEARIRRKDGSDLWAITSATPAFDADRRYAGALGMLTDISARKKAEEALQQAHDELELRVQERTEELVRVAQDLQVEIADRQRAEEALLTQFHQLSTIFDSMNALVYVADLQNHELLFVNEYGLSLFGPDIIGKPCYRTLQSGQSGPCAFCTNHLLVRDGEPVPPHIWEFQNTVTGRWFQCIDRAIHWSDGRLVRMEIAVDITARKEMERQLAAAYEALQVQNEEFQAQQEELQSQNEEIQCQQEDLVAQKEETERWAAELDTIIASIADAVVVFGLAEEPARMNLAAERMLGFSLAEYKLPTVERGGLLRMETVDGEPLSPDESPIVRAQRGETVEAVILRLYPLDGRTLCVSCSAAPIRSPAGNIIGAVVTLTDISRLLELQEQRERLLAQVQQDRQRMEEMLRLVSHDLRNPLTSVMGQAQFLERHLVRKGLETEARSARAITTSATRMNAMIGDLIDSARLEVGQLELHKQPTDLCVFVADIIGRVGTPEDRARLQVESSESVLPLLADLDRLERAIVNLIGNALKYSPTESPVFVRIGRNDRDAVVSVADFGFGIPGEELQNLFSRFYRAKAARSTEGSGLGLYITRLIVEAHGGRVAVESEVGKGSTFYLALPVE